jgi:hypothetical protein
MSGKWAGLAAAAAHTTAVIWAAAVADAADTVLTRAKAAPSYAAAAAAHTGAEIRARAMTDAAERVGADAARLHLFKQALNGKGLRSGARRERPRIRYGCAPR